MFRIFFSEYVQVREVRTFSATKHVRDWIKKNIRLIYIVFRLFVCYSLPFGLTEYTFLIGSGLAALKSSVECGLVRGIFRKPARGLSAQVVVSG